MYNVLYGTLYTNIIKVVVFAIFAFVSSPNTWFLRSQY